MSKYKIVDRIGFIKETGDDDRCRIEVTIIEDDGSYRKYFGVVKLKQEKRFFKRTPYLKMWSKLGASVIEGTTSASDTTSKSGDTK